MIFNVKVPDGERRVPDTGTQLAILFFSLRTRFAWQFFATKTLRWIAPELLIVLFHGRHATFQPVTPFSSGCRSHSHWRSAACLCVRARSRCPAAVCAILLLRDERRRIHGFVPLPDRNNGLGRRRYPIAMTIGLILLLVAATRPGLASVQHALLAHFPVGGVAANVADGDECLLGMSISASPSSRSPSAARDGHSPWTDAALVRRYRKPSGAIPTAKGAHRATRISIRRNTPSKSCRDDRRPLPRSRRSRGPAPRQRRCREPQENPAGFCTGAPHGGTGHCDP